MPHSVDIIGKAFSFLKGNGGEVDRGERRGGGSGRRGGRGAVARMYCLREEFF